MNEHQIYYRSVKPSRKKIFLIEDDFELADFMRLFFENIRVSYQIINRTDDVLPLIAGFKPDLVILDYLLPEINGGELCAQIKKNSSTSSLPVLIYSAYPKVLCSLGDYGCDAFLAKPFDLTELEKIIQNLAGTTLSLEAD
ncbi:response regulator [Pedobacter steynii]|uniref:Response regulatory domain-containing protein n=1 Tax=Pedobacter steynii TaxID=430522 RepID=A0A1D7QJQ2_9SPHI|nr:response regulator [Pedobacter steynii]AOM78873.1 hypothetical protein BFS30_17870 [Pedobacter steynii]